MSHFLFFGCRYMSFCKKSLAVTKALIPMASFLHVKKLSLSHFILSDFFHTMYDLINNIKSKTKNNVGGPIWLVQLWSNAVFSRTLIRRN
jgi:hypothetical protein